MRGKHASITAVLAVLAVSTSAEDARAAACIPGFDYAAFGATSIHIQGNASTDSFDTRLGTYATTSACNSADVGTNSTAASGARIQGASSHVCGNVAIGQGGVLSSVISGTGSYLSSSVQSANTVFPAVVVPVVGTNQGNQALAGAVALPPNQTYGAVTCGGCTLTLSTGTYVMDSLSLSSHATINLAITTGPVVVYFNNFVSITSGSAANPGGVPGNLALFGGPAATTIHVQGGASGAFAAYAPSAAIDLQGNANVFGALVGNTVQMQGNAHAHYDRALATYGAPGFACTPAEVSRASPVVTAIATKNAVVQGTFDPATGPISQITSVANVASFRFPYLTGHVRARDVASLTAFAANGTAANGALTGFAAGTILFDARTAVPPPNNSGCTAKGTCRYIFTNTNVPNGQTYAPPTRTFDDGNSAAIGSLIAPTTAVPGIGPAHWQTIVRDVLAGQLGGVDRSIVAVIPSSPIAGTGSRPTMAYVGGTDGMIHAICASTGGTTATGTNICPSLGTELWAFMPRVQLPLVRTNTQRIDGSVHVADAFGDFLHNPATGARSWHTILTFQTGFAIGTKPAVYAIDITDPYTPRLLWEFAQPSSCAAFDLGTGLVVGMGAALVNNQISNLAVAETNNGGAGGLGVYAAALQLETGAMQWQFSYAYQTPPRGVAADLPLPTSGVPGGAVPVGLTNNGFMSHFVMGDLFGNLWQLDARTGTSVTGSSPLFTFTTNRKPIGAPPAIYAMNTGGPQYAAFASGGYTDPLDLPLWSAGTQELIAVKLSGTSTITETAPVCTSCSLVIAQPLGAGERGFSQALVVGTQLFATTDTSDVNNTGYGTSGTDTGHAMAFDLTGNTGPATAIIRGGATSIARTTTTLVMSGADREGTLSLTANTSGIKVDVGSVAKATRTLWLRTQ